MPDMRNCMSEPKCKKDICIDALRILDSCKDKDCFEDTPVLLTDFGQEILERSGSVRVTDTKVVFTDIVIDPVKFSRGFYQVSFRFYTKVTIEACVGLGKTQEIEGIAVNEKKVVLFGGEGNVSVFRSTGAEDDFCPAPYGSEPFSTTKPLGVVEVVDPVALAVKIKDCERRGFTCLPEEVPGCVTGCLNGTLACGCHVRGLYVTLGFFSIIRLERPAQFIVNAADYSVPDKVCRPVQEEDPCEMFSRMAFPVNEFSQPSCTD